MSCSYSEIQQKHALLGDSNFSRCFHLPNGFTVGMEGWVKFLLSWCCGWWALSLHSPSGFAVDREGWIRFLLSRFCQQGPLRSVIAQSFLWLCVERNCWSCHWSRLTIRNDETSYWNSTEWWLWLLPYRSHWSRSSSPLWHAQLGFSGFCPRMMWMLLGPWVRGSFSLCEHMGASPPFLWMQSNCRP